MVGALSVSTILIAGSVAEFGDSLIVQRINHHVFTEPEQVMANIERVTAYLRQKIMQVGGDPNQEALTFIQTRNGRSYHKISNGDY